MDAGKPQNRTSDEPQPVVVPIAGRSVNPDLLRLLPLDARVIVEVGCGAGDLCAHYRRFNPNVRYVGVEPDVAAAQLAGKCLDRVVAGDMESLEIDDLGLQPGSVDCLVYGEVLEQMRDPWRVVRKHASWLREGGVVVACVSNIQHWTIFLQMMQGNWRYQDTGTMARKNLRFFSLDTIKELFVDAGLQVFHILPRVLPSNQFRPFLLAVYPIVQNLGLSVDEFDLRTQALQYVVRAVKSPQLPRGLFIHTCMMEPVCGRIRTQEPTRCLNSIPGVRAVAIEKDTQLHLPYADETKVFIWQRGIMLQPGYVVLQRDILRRGWLTIAEFDDDPDHFSNVGVNNYATFTANHCVQTSTETLAKELRRYNPHVQVFANQLAELPPPRRHAEDGPVTLFFGALNRQPDWAPLMPTLNRVLMEHGEKVRVRVVCDREFHDALETPHKEFEDCCPYERYAEILHGSDIGLLPLNPTRFNSFKSDLKFIECAGHGATVLASPTVYADSIRPGETGLLFESPAEFESQLQRLIEDRDLRILLATNAYQYVAQSRLMAQHYRERYDWYWKMIEMLPRLDAELRSRVPELFE